MENNNGIIENNQNYDRIIFDETYSIKYTKRINVFKYYLFINSCVCFAGLILFIFRIIKNNDILIGYIFCSMAIFHIVGMIHAGMYWSDFKKQKNGESIYLKKYHPDIWKKINLYGEIINRFEYLKYEYGKYIPRNVDPIVDRIRKDRRRNIIYFLPFLLMLFFIIIVLMNS